MNKTLLYFSTNKFIRLFFVAILLTQSMSLYAETKVNEKTHQTKVDKKSILPLEILQEFTQSFDKIRLEYVEQVDDKTILENAIKGMLSGLDPHSAYLDKKDFEEIKEGTSGEFSGLGMEVGMEDGNIKVIAPIDDSPAKRAGIQAGDIIIRINNSPIQGMSLDAAINLMRGKVGTKIDLSVVHEGDKVPTQIKITRDIIHVSSVKVEELKPGYLYARVSSFQSRTASELKSKLLAFKKKNKQTFKGVILDLRNNPGGILSGAIDICDLFLDGGLVVYTKGRDESSISKFSASPGDIVNKLPLIVLVNKGSASASEIVAGALQDHKRAIIMGQQTFGKGSVQTILPMSKNTAIKLTTARYYTPSHRSIQAKGISPDIEIENWLLEKKTSNTLNRIKEADLMGHLANPEDQDKSKTVTSTKKSPPKANSSLLKDDYVLNEALNVLKALDIISKGK